MRWGQRGVGLVAPVCRFAAFAIMAVEGKSVSSALTYEAKNHSWSGGWVVTLTLRVRNANPFAAGASSSGFWASTVAGRALLGFVMDKFGERLSVLAYITLSIGRQLLFWARPAVHRFCCGGVPRLLPWPALPCCYHSGGQAAPQASACRLHGVRAGDWGCRGTISPFTVGAIAGSTGVWVLQPIMVGLLVVMMGVWFAFPKVQKND
ncbi:hypothetical protein B0T11DRAFT_3429 [Plectosphaerella cucumerina]|uniref:Uncharacterized protein n=1 Tax=Plectosphaerella cucumerina TaxID=40658 RepID=A0A8K0X9B8_9PEZI|nr:hypothetical protein B0T11DRAFT_3429 [Plectosphaerella cucumerina]